MKEKYYNVYVTVTLAVQLVFDKKPTKKALREAAVENFLAHPALDSHADLNGHVDKIVTEPAL